MIIRTNGGGGAKTILEVSYPHGAEVKVSQNGWTLKARPDTDYNIFFLPFGGEWEITAKMGDKITEKTVEVTENRVNLTRIQLGEYAIDKGIIAAGITATNEGGREIVQNMRYNDTPCVGVGAGNNIYGVARFSGLLVPDDANTIHVNIVHIRDGREDERWVHIGVIGGGTSDLAIYPLTGRVADNVHLTFRAEGLRGKRIWAEFNYSSFEDYVYFGDFWAE